MELSFKKGFCFAFGVLLAYVIYELVHLIIQVYIIKLGLQALLG